MTYNYCKSYFKTAFSSFAEKRPNAKSNNFNCKMGNKCCKLSNNDGKPLKGCLLVLFQ